MRFVSFREATPPKINIEPENDALEDYFPFSRGVFSGGGFNHFYIFIVSNYVPLKSFASSSNLPEPCIKWMFQVSSLRCNSFHLNSLIFPFFPPGAKSLQIHPCGTTVWKKAFKTDLKSNITTGGQPTPPKVQPSEIRPYDQGLVTIGFP